MKWSSSSQSDQINNDFNTYVDNMSYLIEEIFCTWLLGYIACDQMVAGLIRGTNKS